MLSTSLTALLFQWQSDQIEAVSYIRDGRGLMEEEVVVDFSPDRFNMLETEETRGMIERRWLEATRENTRLYNATKYRLAGQGVKDGRLQLRVGLTDYKAQSSPTIGQDIIREIEPFMVSFKLKKLKVDIYFEFLNLRILSLTWSIYSYVVKRTQ